MSIVTAMDALRDKLADPAFQSEVAGDYTATRVNRPHKALEAIDPAVVEVLVFPLEDRVEMTSRRGDHNQTYQIAIAVRAAAGNQDKQDELLELGERIATRLVATRLIAGDEAWWITTANTIALFDVNELRSKDLFVSVRGFEVT